MKRFIVISIALLYFLALVLVASLTAYSLSTRCTPAPIFSDEFNGSTLDAAKWSTDYPSGSGGEQQYYAPNAFRLDQGILSIRAEPNPTHGYAYTSGIITTQRSFAQTYGHFEIRAKLPRGHGFWPAFWLLPATPNYPVEIDVFEMLGYDPYSIHMSNHWMNQDGQHISTTGTFTSDTDLTTAFHTYAVDWSKSQIKWSVDGITQFSTTEGIPSEPMFMLANFAVGGNWPGFPDASTQFPGIMQIDYIRVFQEQCWPGLGAQ